MALTSVMRRALCVTAIAGLLAASGCGGSNDADHGRTARSMQKSTDDLAAETLPKLVDKLGAKLHAEGTSFLPCELSGWHYEASGNLVDETLSGPAATSAITSAMSTSGLDVHVRSDGSILGSRGGLSLLIEPPTHNPISTLRSYDLDNTCVSFSTSDVDYAKHAQGLHYSELVPPDARYRP